MRLMSPGYKRRLKMISLSCFLFKCSSKSDVPRGICQPSPEWAHRPLWREPALGVAHSANRYVILSTLSCLVLSGQGWPMWAGVGEGKGCENRGQQRGAMLCPKERSFILFQLRESCPHPCAAHLPLPLPSLKCKSACT